MEFKLIIKKINSTLTEDESLLFDAWYNESKEHQDYFKRVKTNYYKSIDEIDLNTEQAWMTLENKLKRSQKTSSFWKYAIAAAVVLLLSIPLVFNFLNPSNTSSETITAAIVPGVDKATLTLDDGSQVVLENGTNYKKENIISNGEKIVYKSQSKKSNAVVYNTLTIPRGGEFFMELADGTKVKLNSDTQIKYPVNFIKGKTRQVELVYGEAYFEVSPSSMHNGSSFVVLNANQKIEVLGTKFNVKAYRDEFEVYTTLDEGKVKVQNTENNLILKPGEQVVLNTSTKEMELRTVDVVAEIAWIHGNFMFNKKPLQDIVKVLSRWYDVDFVLEGEAIKHQKFNGQLSRDQNLEVILELIKTTEQLKSYKIEGNTITLE
ncbi:FecR family protein [Aestuariibaculum suncheonense]|uniref:DUF4974 domain-containing protein n=1 Tax=Aestuariibaculum suncheonense TaxID=1028745 RepID=A0A8J6UC50_9FLAO|nr:FecR domain-containing protein [Aestuariibaculum suncheonense]MBD0836027.1 DUF4974 domain-containing protein [Aestuariibaculum suncheonense]